MIFLISVKSKKSISLTLAKTKYKSVIQTNTFIVAKNLNFVNAWLIFVISVLKVNNFARFSVLKVNKIY